MTSNSAKAKAQGMFFSLPRALLLVCCFLLFGCASIDVIPLKPDGKEDETQEHGVRYYMPQPYLLVARIPESQVKNDGPSGADSKGDALEAAMTEYQDALQKQEQAIADANANHIELSKAHSETSLQSTSSDTSISHLQEKAAAADKLKDQLIAEADASRERVSKAFNDYLNATSPPPSPKQDATKQTNNADQQQGATTPGAASDTSFLASNSTYVLKLIYLPDKSQPMAIRQTGWFGTSSMKPSLQDGWMLTSMDASQDSKTPEILSAAASLLSTSAISALTGGLGGAAKSPPNKTLAMNLGKGGTVQVTVGRDDILRPGLYRFVYSKTTGELIGLRRVTFFGPDGVEPYIENPSGRNQPPTAYP